MREMKELNNQLERQREIIGELQEKINLLKFDISQLYKDRKDLKAKLKRRNDNIKNIRLELSCMKRKGDFSNINSVLAMLNDGWSEDYED